MSVETLSLLIAYPCAVVGLAALGVLCWISEHHGPTAVYGSAS